jgi:hypothetical protein
MKRIEKHTITWGGGLLLLGLLLTCLGQGYPGHPEGVWDSGSGQYELVSDVDGNSQQFRGPVYFETSDDTAALLQDRVFKLHFIHPAADSGNGFGFLIPLKHNQAGISEARYPIRAPGGASHSPAVFGYADILEAGAGLYFTEAGSISILRVDPVEIRGKVDMVMKNAQGRQMRLRGHFSARPLHPAGAF